MSRPVIKMSQYKVPQGQRMIPFLKIHLRLEVVCGNVHFETKHRPNFINQNFLRISVKVDKCKQL